MKEKLPPAEFKKWYRRQYYDAEAEKKKYQEKKKVRDELMVEFIDEAYLRIPKPINRDKYYTEKYKNDDTKRTAYKFAWRSSKIRRLNWNWLPKQTSPFRISNRKGVDRCIKELLNTQ